MTILERLVERRASIQNPNVPLTAGNLLALVGGDVPFSPVAVTPESSLQVTAVHACVRLLADSVAMLPVQTFRRTGPKTREEVPDHPYAQLIGRRPNEFQTRPEFWAAVMGSKLLRGNAYVYRTFNAQGQVTGLYPLPANLVHVQKVPGKNQLYYWLVTNKYAPDALPDILDLDPASVQILLPHEVMHIRDFTLGLLGYSRITLARTIVGGTMAAEEHGARFFANDASPGGVIQAPRTLTDKAFERMKLQWNSLHQGVQNAHLMAILEEGAQWQKIQLDPSDSQWLEARKFGVVEIARLFGVPPHLVGDVERSTSWGTGIEQQTLGFVQFSLLPHLVDLEAKIDVELLARDDPSLFCKFNVDSMERVDMLSRAQALDILRRNGVINADDWRGFEDMEPIGGDTGESFWQPTNMGTEGALPTPQTLDAAVRDIVAQSLAQQRQDKMAEELLEVRRLVRAPTAPVEVHNHFDNPTFDVEVPQPEIHIDPITVEPQITVRAPAVTVNPEVNIVPVRRKVRKTLERDVDGLVVAIVEEELEP